MWLYRGYNFIEKKSIKIAFPAVGCAILLKKSIKLRSRPSEAQSYWFFQWNCVSGSWRRIFINKIVPPTVWDTILLIFLIKLRLGPLEAYFIDFFNKIAPPTVWDAILLIFFNNTMSQTVGGAFLLIFFNKNSPPTVRDAILLIFF